MSSLSRCAGDTIARSTAAVMKLHGGGGQGSIQVPRLTRYGWKRIRRTSLSNNVLADAAGAPVDGPTLV